MSASEQCAFLRTLNQQEEISTMPKTRQERRKVRKNIYLDGQARKPHQHTRVLKQALSEEPTATATGNSEPAMSSNFPQCKPVLSRYTDVFKGMVHQGSEQKRKVAINQHPKKFDTTHYRDLVSQNEWLRQNVFDSLGNYLYCCACIQSALAVSKDLLRYKRSIKRLSHSYPLLKRKNLR